MKRRLNDRIGVRCNFTQEVFVGTIIAHEEPTFVDNPVYRVQVDNNGSIRFAIENNDSIKPVIKSREIVYVR